MRCYDLLGNWFWKLDRKNGLASLCTRPFEGGVIRGRLILELPNGR